MNSNDRRTLEVTRNQTAFPLNHSWTVQKIILHLSSPQTSNTSSPFPHCWKMTLLPISLRKQKQSEALIPTLLSQDPAYAWVPRAVPSLCAPMASSLPNWRTSFQQLSFLSSASPTFPSLWTILRSPHTSSCISRRRLLWAHILLCLCLPFSISLLEQNSLKGSCYFLLSYSHWNTANSVFASTSPPKKPQSRAPVTSALLNPMAILRPQISWQQLTKMIPSSF